jgi:hypothetical protein
MTKSGFIDVPISSSRQPYKKDISMSNPTEDAGVIQTLLERLNSQRLPLALALALKEKVDHGEKLSDYDISKLEEIFADVQTAQPFVERQLKIHPQSQSLVASLLHLYKEILDKATENESKT